MSASDDSASERVPSESHEDTLGRFFGQMEVPEANNPLLVERAAQATWEIYVSYLDKGFTPAQSIFLTAAAMNSNPITPLPE